jgi:AXL receptor tyrosine kinase
VLWELFSFGIVPFAELNHEEVQNRILKGDMLKLPLIVPESLVGMVSKCWNIDPKLRPTFKEIFQNLNQLCDKSPEATLFQSSAILTEYQNIYHSDVVFNTNQ